MLAKTMALSTALISPSIEDLSVTEEREHVWYIHHPDPDEIYRALSKLTTPVDQKQLNVRYEDLSTRVRASKALDSDEIAYEYVTKARRNDGGTDEYTVDINKATFDAFVELHSNDQSGWCKHRFTLEIEGNNFEIDFYHTDTEKLSRWIKIDLETLSLGEVDLPALFNGSDDVRYRHPDDDSKTNTLPPQAWDDWSVDLRRHI